MIKIQNTKNPPRPIQSLGPMDQDDDFVSTVVEGDTASLVTESSSEAVVSLFNCWSSLEEASPFHGVQNNDEVVGLSETAPEEVLRQLQKRLRPEDMPNPPKRRKRPTCCFINYMGRCLGDHESKEQCGITSTDPPAVIKKSLPASCEIGAFSKGPDLSASLSPTDVALEEIDLLDPFFEDEALFPSSKAKFTDDMDEMVG